MLTTERPKPITTWTAVVHFMCRSYFEKPIAVTVRTTLPHVAAAKAVSEAKKRLPPRSRILELRVVLRREKATAAAP